MSIYKAYVYILASKSNGTLYVGVTNNLAKRMAEHKSGVIGGFTCRYDVKQLVYFERFTTFESAIRREKQLKGWKRSWKIGLIEHDNPQWRDLSTDVGVDDDYIEAVKGIYK